MQPNRIVTELYKQGAWKILAFRTSLEPSPFNTTLVNVALFMMFQSVALPTLTTATMTTFVNEIVDASSAVQTTRRGKLLFDKTQVFHKRNTLGLSKNFAKKRLLLDE